MTGEMVGRVLLETGVKVGTSFRYWWRVVYWVRGRTERKEGSLTGQLWTLDKRDGLHTDMVSSACTHLIFVDPPIARERKGSVVFPLHDYNNVPNLPLCRVYSHSWVVVRIFDVFLTV